MSQYSNLFAIYSYRSSSLSSFSSSCFFIIRHNSSSNNFLSGRYSWYRLTKSWFEMLPMAYSIVILSAVAPKRCLSEHYLRLYILHYKNNSDRNSSARCLRAVPHCVSNQSAHKFSISHDKIPNLHNNV